MAKVKYNRVLLKISGEGLCAPGQHGINGSPGSRECPVNAFFGQQQRALNAVLTHQVQQRLAQPLRIVERDKMIQSHNNNF